MNEEIKEMETMENQVTTYGYEEKPEEEKPEDDKKKKGEDEDET